MSNNAKNMSMQTPASPAERNGDAGFVPVANVSNTVERLSEIREVMCAEYRKKHSDPWIVAYSGGKDSTLLLHLAWETLLSLPPRERRREIHIVSNDTLVESPLVIRHLKKSLSIIREAARKAGVTPFLWTV